MNVEQYKFSAYNQNCFAETYVKCFYIRPDGEDRGWNEYKHDEQPRMDNINRWLKQINDQNIFIVQLTVVFSKCDCELTCLIEFDERDRTSKQTWRELFTQWYDDENFYDGLSNADCPCEMYITGCMNMTLVINEQY
jgi:hypothetical protein